MCMCVTAPAPAPTPAPAPARVSERQYETCSRQLVFPMGIEAYIPEDDMVRFFAREFENLDYTTVIPILTHMPLFTA